MNNAVSVLRGLGVNCSAIVYPLSEDGGMVRLVQKQLTAVHHNDDKTSPLMYLSCGGDCLREETCFDCEDELRPAQAR